MLSDQFDEPEQLKMFMSAREITRSRRPDDVTYMGRQETPTQVWDRKRGEAEESGLARDIVQKGVETPIELMKSSVINGQHRVAVMMAHEPDQLNPVIHHQRRKDSFSGAVDRAWPAR